MNIKNLYNKSELALAVENIRSGLFGVILLSVAINVLTLAGSIYLMMVYDRVLPGQSVPTLLSLFLMVSVAYAFHGIFDVMRSRMLADIAMAFDQQISGRVQTIELRFALELPDSKERVSPTRDLDQLRTFIGSSGLLALIDLPWIVFFMLVLALVHYWLGIVAVLGALVLASLAWRAELVSSRHVGALSDAAGRRRKLADRQWRHAELISSLGMRQRATEQWQQVNNEFLDYQSRLTDAGTTLSGVSKIFRMFLQSLVLTVGALLVIEGKASAGIIFASSMLLGRALAPVDQAIGNWRNFVAARQSWNRLKTFLAQIPEADVERTRLPAPKQSLKVERLVLVPPGGKQPTVHSASFSAVAGQAIGIVGPSGSGKSSLLRGVIGAWRVNRGTIRLDGATLDQWDSDELGRHIGYLPQSVELFDGTVAENIARFELDAPSDVVVAAAQAAGVHNLILQLPQGYDTQVGEEGGNLSAGQRQRIALARALFRDPFLLVLDEPNSNLDSDGELALSATIEAAKKRDRIVLLVAHHSAILKAVNLLLVMKAGKSEAFGPRNEVLAGLNAARLPRSPPEDVAGALAVVKRA